MDVISYLVDTLLWLLTLAFLLRLLFQLVRADFRDPLADAIVRVTNWLIRPLRRVLPPAGKVDSATVVAVCAMAALRVWARFALYGVFAVDLGSLLHLAAIGLADLLLRVYLFALLIYWMSSFLAPRGHSPGIGLAADLCEPVLRRIRRWIPPIGQIDFSVLWASIAIGAMLVLLARL
ncbi:MAG: YggT family protein [Gammaproteobacteria bacterium]|nr:YggT family protein [Gammaproteobacteria bacterium]MDE2304853.1 YggT family protein [Gammaproteobacteria bacterium]